MAASNSFFSILNEIQKSNLNFKIELSPFSAIVTLKKTVIRDSKGFSALPSPPSSFLLQQAQFEVSKLSQEISSLKSEHVQIKQEFKSAVEKCEKLDEANEKLQLKYDGKIKVEDNFLAKQIEADVEKKEMKNRIRHLEDHIKNTNAKLTETSSRLLREKAAAEKALKQEIKEWKKELGAERKLKIRLEKKLAESHKKCETSSSPEPNLLPASTVVSSTLTSNKSLASDTPCYICAEPITNYIPKTFLGHEVNPACKYCYDESDHDEIDIELQNNSSSLTKDMASYMPNKTPHRICTIETLNSNSQTENKALVTPMMAASGSTSPPLYISSGTYCGFLHQHCLHPLWVLLAFDH